MSEPQAAYDVGTIEPKPYYCKCGMRLGWLYSVPRRLVIVTDNIHFVIRGDALITHTECGAVNQWCYKREHHGMLKELETGQAIIDTEELTETNTE